VVKSDSLNFTVFTFSDSVTVFKLSYICAKAI
jgi:hypothetical protein